jgi:O-antigen/teichoic acid export membrane protein
MPNVVGFRRALLLSTAASALVPIVGVVTAPILAQSLGVAGRGEVAAALAPGLLVSSAGTLGLPEALTFKLARRPEITRAALGWTALFASIAGIVFLIGTVFASPFLANGDRALARLIVLATVLTIPALLVNLLRGAAAGRQMWTELTTERILNGVLRLVAIAGLAWFGHLNILNAVLVASIAPILGGVMYWRLLVTPPPPLPVDDDRDRSADQADSGTALALLKYGSSIWLGSVATMVVARLSQFLMVPLSDVEQLGILIVAITIAEVPFILMGTIRDVLFSVESAESNPERLAYVSRLTSLLIFVGALVMGATLPLWIGPLFGAGFTGAIVPTWITLLSHVVSVPGLMVGAGLASCGRPSFRSLAIIVALVGNLVGLLVLVPYLGAVGAALAGVLGNVLALVLSLILAKRLLGISASALMRPRLSDVRVEISRLGAYVRERQLAHRASGD